MENQNQYQTNKCVYCSRTYKKKENYSKHVITCAFFHNVHLQSRDDFNLSVEDLPSQREMFLLMKELANKCHELEKKSGASGTNREYTTEEANHYVAQYAPHNQYNSKL